MFKPTLALMTTLGLATLATGCAPCIGVEEPSVTLDARLAQTMPRATWTDDLLAYGTPLGPDVVSWQTNIRDAAASQPSTGSLTLENGTEKLLLALPFPMRQGATLTPEADITLLNQPLFATGPARTSVGVWLDPTCPTDNLAPCAAARAQTVTGVVEVQSTSPLRLGLSFTISFPSSAQPPRTIDGTMTFSATPGSFCNKDN